MPVPGRYTIVRINPNLVHLLDSKFNNAVAAKVWRANTVDGSGWRFGPMTAARRTSRKLHATPEAAIASMRYMTLTAARAAISKAVAA